MIESHNPSRTLLMLFTLVITTSVAHQPAQAGGFAVDEQGAAAMGMANAFAAQASDPTALFYNPAGISRLHGTQVSLGTTLIAPVNTFASESTGLTTETKSVVFYPPTLYLAHEVGPTAHVGLGLFVPFGLSSEWPASWEGRYVTTFSEINTLYINPTVAWTPAPNLHLAAGVSYVPSSVTMLSRLELTPSPDGYAEITGDGDGWGYNLAALAAVTPKTTIGASYRSAVKVDYSGRGEFSPLGLSDRITSSLTLPASITLGAAHRFSDDLLVETDWQWVGWSAVDRISIDFSDPAFPISDVTTPKNWQNSWSLRVGAEQALGDMVLRTGYAYDRTPIPPETLDPSLPDSDKHTFAFGGGRRFGKTGVDLAYMYIVSRDRRAGNTIPTGGTPYDHRGQYSSRTHELGVSVSYRF